MEYLGRRNRRCPRRRLISAFPLLLAGATACQGTEVSPRSAAVPDTLSHTVLEFTRGLEGCTGPYEGCGWVGLRYPDFPQRLSPAGDSAREWVARHLLGSVDPDGTPAQGPELFAQRFLAAVEEFQAEFPQAATGGWFMEREVAVRRNDLQVVGLELREHVYMGGAHSNFFTVFGNLDRGTGASVPPLEALLQPGADASLLEQAEEELRRVRELPSELPLTEAGYWEDRLPLPGTFLLARDGLLLYYNPYEVTSFAMGPDSLLLPWAAVAPLLREPQRWIPPS